MTHKTYQLMLFVADNQPNSVKAKKHIKQICRDYLDSDYYLEIIDVLKDPEVALKKRVYVTPMLVVAAPLPAAYVAGDMSDTARVLAALKIESG